ncbi:MAG: small basic protein [Phycisphaerales bacterium]|nr:small basic protein [Phycisphaerales bacterium]
MSIDRSLRLKSSLQRHRNVLSRSERVAYMIQHDLWKADESPLGLPKISHRKAKASKKAKKEEAAAATGTAAPAAAPAAPAGKAATPPAKAGTPGKK